MLQAVADNQSAPPARRAARWLPILATFVVMCVCLAISLGALDAGRAQAGMESGRGIAVAPAQENDFDLSRNTITVTKQTLPDDCGRPWRFEATGIKDFVLTGGESLPFPLLAATQTYTFYETNLPNGWALELWCEGGTLSTWTVISRTHVAGEGDDSCGSEHTTMPSDHEKKERNDLGVAVYLAPDEAVTCTFFNKRKPQIRPMRYEDPEGDGILTGSEAPQMDWDYRLFKWMEGAWKPVKEVQTTNVDGMAKFGGLKAGEYRVCEIQQVGWYNSIPGDLAIPDPSDSGMICQPVTLPDEYGYLDIVPFAGTRSGAFALHKSTDPPGGTGFGYSHTFDGSGSATLADGEIQLFVELPAGAYSVTESLLPDGWELTDIACDDGSSTQPSLVDVAQGSVSARIEPGETVSCTFSSTLVGGATLGDRIWLDTIADGIQDDPAIEPGVGGIVVTLHYIGGQIVAQQTSDADGFYRFDDVIPGDYYLTFANQQQDLVWTSPLQGSDTAVDSDALEPVDATDIIRRSPAFALAAAAVDLSHDAGLTSVLGAASSGLGGRVWLDADRDGIRDADERGAPDITVRLFPASVDPSGTGDDAFLAETLTDSHGEYIFDALDAGRYRIQVAAPPHHLLAPAQQGSDPLRDSHFDADGVSPGIYLPPATIDARWDAGLIANTPTALEPIEEIALGNSRLFLPAIICAGE